jgi:Domain of unknown function (DUF2017)
MEPFRRTRGGGARAWLAASEASLLRSLVGQVMTLIAPEGPEPRPGAPGEPDGADIAALEALLHQPAGSPGESPAAPEDPVLARLLPDGYRDDPEAAGEFRRYTESGLRSGKQQAAQEMLDTLPDAGGRIQLTQDQAVAWLKALNDVRLALGVRLGVTEDFEEQWASLNAEDPQWAAFEVYAWLGAVQESLVQALA